MPLIITSFIVVSRLSIPASPTNFHNSIGKLSGPLAFLFFNLRYLALQNRIVATRSGYNEHIGPERIIVYAHFKDCKFNKVAIFNGIVLIQVACSSLSCTLSLYNVFMWTVSVKAGQKRTEARRTKEQTKEHWKERTYPVDFLNVLSFYIFVFPYLV